MFAPSLSWQNDRFYMKPGVVRTCIRLHVLQRLLQRSMRRHRPNRLLAQGQIHEHTEAGLSCGCHIILVKRRARFHDVVACGNALTFQRFLIFVPSRSWQKERFQMRSGNKRAFSAHPA